MSRIDLSQPVWRVSGHINPSDNRRCTTFVNAVDERSALIAAQKETPDVVFASAEEIDPKTGFRK
jgi:hypothetical protein